MNETLAAWLNIFLPVATVVLAGLVSFVTAKYQLNKPQRSSILETQYKNVLAPLHRVWFFESSLGKAEKHKEIEKILGEHYGTVPRTILECWQEDKEKQFPAAIDLAYKVAAHKLGYTQIKIKKRDLPKELPPEKAKALLMSIRKFVRTLDILLDFVNFV